MGGASCEGGRRAAVDALPEALAAAASALPEGLSLVHDGAGLALTDGGLHMRGDFGRAARRARPGNLHRELLVRAAKMKTPGRRPVAVDATAGLGEDSYLLAATGFEVTMFERNPVVAALLADALQRASYDPVHGAVVEHMHLVEGDSLDALASGALQADLVLLDPMFPERGKRAAAKKKLQLLQRIERPCDDEEALFLAAEAACPRKIVVKRPTKGPHLAGRKPDYSLEGKAVRFDCYAFAPAL